MKLIRYAYPAPTDFDRVFGALFPANSRWGGVFDTFLAGSAGTPAADLYEDADNYYVKVELPGVRKEDITVALEDAALTIAATRAEKGAEGETRAEFRRTVGAPEGVDAGKVTAAYENGVLTVTLPKPEARKPRQITVA